MPSPSSADRERAAAEIAAAMWSRDIASRTLGIETIVVGAGHARMRLVVREHMLNGNGVCHGAYIFALADTVFAFASNSTHPTTVAAAGSIEFLRPGQAGDVLVGEATQAAVVGRTCLYDVRIVNQRNEVVAAFRGRSVRIRIGE